MVEEQLVLEVGVIAVGKVRLECTQRPSVPSPNFYVEHTHNSEPSS
jgi:hypothetical protein